jgi:hypothetical protein
MNDIFLKLRRGKRFLVHDHFYFYFYFYFTRETCDAISISETKNLIFQEF